MKKFGVVTLIVLLAFGFLFMLSSVPFVTADNHTNDTSSTTTEQQQDQSKTDDGFQCLEEKVGTSCSGLSVQETALVILATPDDDVFDACVDALKDKRSSNNWGNVRDTALGILALDHAGQDTEASEEWLLDQTLTPTDLIWYLEQDSNEAVTCNIGYNAGDYSITIGDNKKIDRNAGSCLTRAQSNFWLQISSSCYDTEFVVECDKDFIATLLYKNRNSPTIHVLEGTQSSPAFGSVILDVNSTCFGTGSTCDYEGSAWATIALLRTGHDVEPYLPYLIALSDTNEQYLPNSFVYMATNYEDYADDLVSEVKLGNFWQADRSAYNKFYDTSLAIVALGSTSSSEQVVKAKDWLLFSQGQNGCWQNSVRETAAALWALEGRSGRASGSSGSGGGVTYCSEAGYFCIPTAECPAAENVGNNYFCSSLSETCCTTENLNACSAMGGNVCTGDTVCTGNERRALDTDFCCTGECVERPQQTECEASFYTCMDTACSDSQEPVVGYSCNVGQVCCRAQTSTSEDSGGSLWWLWVIIIMLIILLVLAIIFRKRLQAWFNERKNKKGKGKPGAAAGGVPPGRRGPPPRGGRRPPARRGRFGFKPGFPPVRRQAPPVSGRKRAYDRRDPEMSDTFKKLREMSGK